MNKSSGWISRKRRHEATYRRGYADGKRTAQQEFGVRWLPIDQADRSITDVQDFSEVGVMLRLSDRYWVRDEDGRIYEAVWTDDKTGYWWDLEGESPVDPVEFMPHPQDVRFAGLAGTSLQDVQEERYRHKKRGSTYIVTARGRLQVDGDLDNEKVVVYRGEDGQTWVRPEYEFNDGRFELLSALPKQEGGE